MENNPETNGNSRTPEIPPGVRAALLGLALLTAVGGVCRANGWGVWDHDTLLFFVIAAVIVFLPWIGKFKFSSKGVEVETTNLIKKYGTFSGKKPRAAKKASAIPEALAKIATAAAPADSPARHLAAPALTSHLSAPSIAIEPPPSRAATPVFDEDDPQKGRWGGNSFSSTRALTATVYPAPGMDDWFVIKLTVAAINTKNPLTGPVTFHLHPTFKESEVIVLAENNQATLKLVAWGAFTVGAECDNGTTPLELNLAELPGAPEIFCRR